jgi:hypothetical protein
MNINPVNSQSKINGLQTALAWLNRGISPVPLVPNSKRPSGGAGWNKVKITEPMIVDYFRKTSNVGGLWGKPSDWLVDIDIDCNEACQLAPMLLPETLIYGRGLRPSSHYIYRCRNVSNMKFRSREFATLIEIRSTGSQSVLPPSRHPDGDTYELNHDIEFFKVGKGELIRYVSELAAATLFVKRFPGEGGRHDYIHAVTGALLREGWPRDKIKRFMDAVLAVMGGETDKSQRARTIENTIKNYAKGNKVYGWATLASFIPEDEIASIRVWVRSLRRVTVTKVKKELPPKEPPKEVSALDKFKPEWLEVPGMVGDLIRYSQRYAFNSQPMFDLVSGIMAMALITQNRYVISWPWDTPLQPYMMIVSGTSGGKDTYLTLLSEIATKLGLADSLVQGFQSFYSMMDLLSQPPNMALMLWDEIGRKLKSAQNVMSPDYQIITTLIELYGKGNKTMAKMPGRKNTITSIRHPFLLILATTQPEILNQALSAGDVMSGLMNRFVLFDCGRNFAPYNENRVRLFPAKIEDFHNKLKAIPLPGGDSPFIQVGFESAAVGDMFKQFNESTRRQANELDAVNWGRSNQNALIFAGLVAVGMNCKRPVITEAVAKWAMDIISWSCESWTAKLSRQVSVNKVEANSKKVEEVIFSLSTIATKIKYRETQRITMRDGWMPRAVLMAECRSLSKRELDEILVQLEEMGHIEIGDHEGREVYRPKL